MLAGRGGARTTGGGDGVAQAEGTAVGGKVGALCLLHPQHAHKQEGGQKGLLAKGRGAVPSAQKEGEAHCPPVTSWNRSINFSLFYPMFNLFSATHGDSQA